MGNPLLADTDTHLYLIVILSSLTTFLRMSLPNDTDAKKDVVVSSDVSYSQSVECLNPENPKIAIIIPDDVRGVD